jgi:hypothetical protein
MPDTIVLEIPTERSFRDVASLVLGGVGTRFDLSYERMDDVQLAVLSMLDAAASEHATIEVAADGDRLSVSVGPLRSEARSDEGLGRVLRPLADGYELEDRDGSCWATLVIERATSSPA